MKRKMTLWCLGVFCVLMLAGCAANPAGMQVPADPTASEETAGEETFKPEDVKTFTFEGEEYTFPLSYDVLVEQGWTVTDYSYDLLSEEDLTTNFLALESDAYPGVELDIYIWDDLTSVHGFGSVEELVNEFETNGIWGIGIGPVDDETEVVNYPEFSIQGVTFGSSAEDIVNTFGRDFGATSKEGKYYIYLKGGSALICDIEDDAIYSLYACFC